VWGRSDARDRREVRLRQLDIRRDAPDKNQDAEIQRAVRREFCQAKRQRPREANRGMRVIRENWIGARGRRVRLRSAAARPRRRAVWRCGRGGSGWRVRGAPSDRGCDRTLRGGRRNRKERVDFAVMTRHRLCGARRQDARRGGEEKVVGVRSRVAERPEFAEGRRLGVYGVTARPLRFISADGTLGCGKSCGEFARHTNRKAKLCPRMNTDSHGLRRNQGQSNAKQRHVTSPQRYRDEEEGSMRDETTATSGGSVNWRAIA
jgi:hypothetical protein